MKKYILYISLPLIGLLLGWMIFGGNSVPKDEQTKETADADQMWTCSMHPQIRQPEPGDCPICGMDLIPLKENASQNSLVFSMSEDAIRLANIQTTVVGSAGGANGNGMSLSGRIEADETAASSVVTHISGRIEKLYIGFTGERVSRGQRVAKIYSSEFITAQRELLEAYKVREVSPGLLEAAKNKLRYWKISNDQINKIIEGNQVNEYVDIRSDHTGIVARKLVAVGDHLKQGEALFEVQNLGNVWAVFDAYETQLSDIHLGDVIRFTTPSLAGEEFSSNVSFIDPVIDPKSRTARIRMEMNNANGRLKPDMFINGSLAGKPTEKSSLTIPKSAVLWTGERSVVYVKVPELTAPSFEYREITLGAAQGNSYEVLSGLQQGEEVVTNGAFVIDASAQLNNQASMMNRKLLESSKKEPSTKSVVKLETSMAFNMQLSKVTESYLAVKNALVGDNAKTAQLKAKELQSELNKVDMKLLEGEAHLLWMKQLKPMREALGMMAESNKIEKQRKAFDLLSQHYIEVIQSFGAGAQNLYIQECPMAFNDRGAQWLSREKKVLNPYFGADMLNCGSVVQSINSEKNQSTDHSGHVH